MTIREANTIPLVKLLEILGFHPINTPDAGNDIWYRSPFRPAEHSTNFHVDRKRNIWFDFILNKGGSNIAFIQAYNDCDENAALAFISDHFAKPHNFKQNLLAENPSRKERFTLKEVKPLTNPSLLAYLTDERKIKLDVVKKTLVEVLYKNSEDQKEYFSAALKNESNGYEIRNKYFEGFLGKKDISILRGGQPTENSVSIFIDMWDFLSAIAYYGDVITAHDIIIIHHTEFVEKTLRLATMRQYSRVFTYFPNTEIGEGYTKMFQEALVKKHEPCFGFYYPFESFHAYWKVRKKN